MQVQVQTVKKEHPIHFICQDVAEKNKYLEIQLDKYTLENYLLELAFIFNSHI